MNKEDKLKILLKALELNKELSEDELNKTLKMH